MPTQVGIPFFETPSKQLRGITLGKGLGFRVYSAHTLKKWDWVVMVLFCLSHTSLLSSWTTSSHSYVVRCTCKNPLSCTALEICIAWVDGRVCLVPSQWVKPTSMWWTLFPKHKGPHSAITLSKPFIRE
jgi:hypothetical protein